LPLFLLHVHASMITIRGCMTEAEFVPPCRDITHVSLYEHLISYIV